jgi:hypothetical protein
MTIDVRPDQAEAISKAIESGVIKTADEVVALGLKSLNERLSAPPAATDDEWLRKIREWAHSHPTDTPLLSDEAVSRESIYRDRGL